MQLKGTILDKDGMGRSLPSTGCPTGHLIKIKASPLRTQQTFIPLIPLCFVVSWLEYSRLCVCANMP